MEINNKVLYIEDNPSNILLMKVIFRNFKGFELSIKETAEEGLEWVYTDIPDLILMDKDLPLMSGLEATHILKNNVNFKNIPIILLTADNDVNIEKHALDVGCNDVEFKPFDIVNLKTKIMSYF
ncbi:response regulator [Pseudoalteromonas denitrificans]|uniref:Two-component system, cell cycle response regulator DivK n=1 Tax=Pseudoalteromonas denitrificans DSM 6059 TaxID=1123010 RepID=A0A1I1MQM0_9GAMM|nr:response regulator [Pseudoalteromonas denitrificans]SFC87465.1 two-component system, cell cycle response regulator DivK [Pseudoalteromonas denitrificans DSM 6059]